MFLSRWFRNLIASEPAPSTFMISNPAMSGKADSVTSCLIPGSPDSPEWVVSVYWTASEEKLFEKRFPDQETSMQVLQSINGDLQQAAEMTQSGKEDEAKNLMGEIMKKYNTESDALVEGNPVPLTHTMAKQAKVVMQNIFFSTPDEAMEYQEKMKKLNPGTGDSNVLPGLKDLAPGQEGEEVPGDEIAPPSVSYKDMEKDKAKGEKDLNKHIEREVKDQVQSALDKKIATLFEESDDILLDAMRGKGRTWEEIRDYFIKELKYDKEAVAAYIDQHRGTSENSPGTPGTEAPMPGLEDVKPSAPKPPKETVSPETHERLLDEVNEIPQKEEAMVAEIERQDGEIRKIALDPLQAPPVMDGPGTGDYTEEEGPAGQPEPEPSETEMGLYKDDAPISKPQPGDYVVVLHDYATNSEGFKGKFIGEFKSHGDTFAHVEDEISEVHEVPMGRVVKADMRNEADRIRIEATSNGQVIDMFINDSFPKDKLAEWGTANLRISKQENGWALINYSTPIMYRDNKNGETYFNVDRYSATTSKIQNYIRQQVRGLANEVNEKGIRQAIHPTAPAPLTQMPVTPAKPPKQVAPATPPPETQASKELNLIKAELEAISKEVEAEEAAPAPVMETKCEDCGKPLGPEVFLSKWPICGLCTRKKHKKVTQGSLEVSAAPVTPLEPKKDPEVLPVDYKPVKVAPPHTDREKAIPATPEIEKTFGEIKAHEQQLANIKNIITDLTNKFNENKKQIEEQHKRMPHEAELKAQIERLSMLVDATTNKLVQIGDELVSFKSQEKTVPVKWTHKEQLEHVIKEFPKVSAYLEKAMQGAQNAATREISRELRVFPKLSKLDRKAGLMESLADIANNLTMALELLMGGGTPAPVEVVQ